VFSSISNPEIMNEEDRILYQNCIDLFSDLLIDLNHKNYLKKMKNIPANHSFILDMFMRFTKAYNMMLDALYPQQKMEDFINKNKGSGFTAKDIPDLFVSQVISSLILSSEGFKNNILAIIQWKKPFSKRMGLGTLLKALKKVSPKYGTEVKKLLDSQIRNSLVHGTFWLDDDSIFYCDDIRLIKPREIKIFDLLMLVKKTHIVNTALFTVMVDYAVKGIIPI